MYTRADPSPRYAELLTAYRTMHEMGEVQSGMPADKTFAGFSLWPHLATIKKMASSLGARTLLDYGAGKGVLHYVKPMKLPEGGHATSLASYWDLERTVCYDPGYAPHAQRPIGTFDLVVCCDVLEHCPEEDIKWILEDIAGHARRGVFLVIACYRALKSLPSGENAHVTVHPPDWWLPRIEAAAALRAGLAWKVVLEEVVDGEVRVPGSKSKFTVRVGQSPTD